MSTISERIRAAALGPTPYFGNSTSLSEWVGAGDKWTAVHQWFDIGVNQWHQSDDDTRRTFLLFVAEAIE